MTTVIIKIKYRKHSYTVQKGEFNVLNLVAENLAKIKKTTENYKVKIVAVTKYYSAQKMVEAFECGLRDFGESRIPESIEKINSLDDAIRSKSEYHLIGHLQRNKVKRAVGFFNLIHSVDSLKLADEISKEAQEKGVEQKILIQVNNANEEQKYGIAPSQLDNFIDYVSKLPNIKLEGLMNIAPLTDERKEIEKLFLEMKKLKEAYQLKELSMGMSNDYKIALDCGSTMIRLGRILFE